MNKKEEKNTKLLTQHEQKIEMWARNFIERYRSCLEALAKQ